MLLDCAIGSTGKERSNRVFIASLYQKCIAQEICRNPLQAKKILMKKLALLNPKIYNTTYPSINLSKQKTILFSLYPFSFTLHTSYFTLHTSHTLSSPRLRLYLRPCPRPRDRYTFYFLLSLPSSFPLTLKDLNLPKTESQLSLLISPPLSPSPLSQTHI